jgi:multidrug transporter EmrE-like cation transporter
MKIIFIVYLLLTAIFSAISIPFIKQYTITKNVLWLVLSLLCYIILIWLYTIILHMNNISIIYSILKVLDVLLVIAFGMLFFHETLTLQQIIGIILSIISVFIIIVK